MIYWDQVMDTTSAAEVHHPTAYPAAIDRTAVTVRHGTRGQPERCDLMTDDKVSG